MGYPAARITRTHWVSRQPRYSPISWQRITFLRSTRSARSSTWASPGRRGCAITSLQEPQGGQKVPLHEQLAGRNSSHGRGSRGDHSARVAADRRRSQVSAGPLWHAEVADLATFGAWLTRSRDSHEVPDAIEWLVGLTIRLRRCLEPVGAVRAAHPGRAVISGTQRQVTCSVGGANLSCCALAVTDGAEFQLAG